MIGLNLTDRHPERVRLLVAHEPPCVMPITRDTIISKLDAVFRGNRGVLGTGSEHLSQDAGGYPSVTTVRPDLSIHMLCTVALPANSLHSR